MTVGVGQVTVDVGFVLEDNATGGVVTTLHPDRGSTPSLEHDATRNISRRLTGLRLVDSEDLAVLDPIRQRVRPTMTVDGVEWPLGVYLFAGQTTSVRDGDRPVTVELLDRGLILDQAVEHTVSLGAGGSVGALIVDLCAEANLEVIIDTPSAVTAAAPILWRIGTSRSQVLADLADLAGYLRPWFDNNGRLRFRPTVDPAGVPVDFDLSAGTTTVRDSIAATSDLLDAPNRFIVLNTGPGDTPVVGRYDVPASAPHSIANRGFAVVNVTEIQGVAGSTADEVARTVAARYPIFEAVELSSLPDPRHDGYDVVRFEGENWLEIGWTLPLSSNGVMGHRLRKAYA